MTNKQLAAARRAMARYPQLRIEKEGMILTPVLIGAGTRGVSVTAAPTMTPGQLETALKHSCGAFLA